MAPTRNAGASRAAKAKVAGAAVRPKTAKVRPTQADPALAPKTSARGARRNAEMLEIVARVTSWAGGPLQAMAWFRGQPIAAFGDRTAESLVKSGQAAAVRDYLDSIALGGFA